MTLFFPDISSYENGLRIQPGTVAVIAKATEGIHYTDANYADFKAQAAAVGALFSGYHFLRSDSEPTQQANHYFDVAGTTPCMLDVETTGSSKPGVDFVVAFMNALKGRGGRVWGVYFPQWYWGEVGGDLSRVTALGAVLVASSYRAYSDTAWPGSYGGATPRVWQYTSTQSYGGQSVDFNAFKGTVTELSEIIHGDNMNPVDVWAWRNANLDPIDMRQRLVNAENAAEAANAKLDQVLAKLNNLTVVGGADPKAVADAELAEIKARL